MYSNGDLRQLEGMLGLWGADCLLKEAKESGYQKPGEAAVLPVIYIKGVPALFHLITAELVTADP